MDTVVTERSSTEYFFGRQPDNLPPTDNARNGRNKLGTMIVRGAHVHDFRKAPDKAGYYTEVLVHGDMSKPVAEQMKWEDLVYNKDIIRTGWDQKLPLDGDLVISHLRLTFSESRLELHLDTEIATDFHLQRVKVGEGTKTELRFKVRTRDKDAAAKIEAYLNVAGDGPGLMQLAHGQSDNEDQGDLFTGQKESEPEPAATLASAREVNGKTRPGINRQRNRRGGDETVVTDDEGQPVLTGEAAEQHEAMRRKAKSQPGVN